MGAIGGLVSGAIGLIGAIQEAKAAKERGEAQGYALNYQAQVARYNAMFATRLGMNAAETQSFKTGANVSAIKAAQAANGVDVNSGSASRVAGSAEKLGKADALTIRANAARTAFGYTTQSILQDVEADEARKAGQLDASAAMIGGIGSLVGGAMSMFTDIGGSGGSAYGGYSGAAYSGSTAGVSGGGTVMPVGYGSGGGYGGGYQA